MTFMARRCILSLRWRKQGEKEGKEGRKGGKRREAVREGWAEEGSKSGREEERSEARRGYPSYNNHYYLLCFTLLGFTPALLSVIIIASDGGWERWREGRRP